MTQPSIARITVRATPRRQYVCQSCLWYERIARQLPQNSFQRCATRALSLPSIASTFQRAEQRASRAGIKFSRHQQRRQASGSSLSSNSAINAPSYVPDKYKNVHESLVKLQEDAAAYIDLSRLQLALKSYERDRPTIRVGVLSIGTRGLSTARSLIRLLLSDLLGSAQPWEQELLDAGQHDGRSILVRYGQSGDIAPSNAVVKTILIPSAWLQEHQLEFLITPFSTQFAQDQRTSEDTEDALLVPSLTIPASAGRVGFVRNPVHRSILVAAGIDGALQLGRAMLPSDTTLLLSVIDVDGPQRDQQSDVALVDTKKATKALDDFRSDLTSSTFATDWVASGVSDIHKWLGVDEPAANTKILSRFATSTLAAVEQAIDRAADSQSAKTEVSDISETSRTDLETAITGWAADAHDDLRHNLLSAMDSRAWRRTSWFRLLWRIDDVSYSCIDILNQCWLNETEQRLAFLSGRIRQSGLASEAELKESADVKPLLSTKLKADLKAPQPGHITSSELLQLPTMLSRVDQETGLDLRFDPPWPQTINLARQLMLHVNVPNMHRKAQSLVLTTLTTIGGTSALSAWLWVATSGVALYECGAIAALGLMWSLRRLQKLWGKERDGFSLDVQENGRRVLVEIEDQLRRLVRDGGRAPPVSADVESIARARSAVQRCRASLADLAS